MFLIRLTIFTAVLAGIPVVAQTVGTLEINGRVRIEGKQERLERKRFFLFPGGLADNKPLIDRLLTSAYVSRDCFYCRLNASSEFRAWLKAEDCESPFCREITAEDATKVPEFRAALAKGRQQFSRKPAIAQDWLTTNLDASLRDGYYLQRKTAVEKVLGGVKPLLTSMTDSVSVKAIFIDIPIKLPAGKKTQTFLISNLVPFEVGTKSYLWACEVEIGTEKKAVRSLTVPEPGKSVDKCEVLVRDLPSCEGQSCKGK
jgi:hypothetical protein